jgi:hypothetical protein
MKNVPHYSSAYTRGNDERAYSKGEQQGTEESTHEPLYSLFRRQLDQRSSTKQFPTDICHDIVTDDQGSGDKEPDHTLENTVDDKVARDDD